MWIDPFLDNKTPSVAFFSLVFHEKSGHRPRNTSAVCYHMKTLVLLVGPKGSGKTTLGKVLGTQKGCVFLEVEKLFMEVMAAGTDNLIERALQRVEAAVEDLFSSQDTVIMESTAAGVDFPALVENYRAKFGRVVLVRIRASKETCLRRCGTRDQTHQIQVDRDSLLLYHDMTEAVVMPWDLEISNDGGEELDAERLLSLCSGLCLW